MTLAYFITFSTYGTWLHGTDRGRGSVDLEHNAYGTPYLPADVGREVDARDAMVQAAYVMDERRREVVRDAIVELCREKGYRLWAMHGRTNHVHIVVTADRDPGRLMSDFKARASRNLTRTGLDDPDRRRWTRHGSTLYLFDRATVDAKIRYTLDEQGAPMALFDGREPRTQ